MNIEYKYKLSDFKIISNTVLKNYNSSSTRTTGNGNFIRAYEVYRTYKFLFWRFTESTPLARFETVYEAEDYIYCKTGEHPNISNKKTDK